MKQKFVDAIEKWLIESGMIDQLAFLVAKTSMVRALILWAAGGLAAKGAIDANYSEALIGVAVTVLTGTVTMFISSVRAKYNARLQHAVGADQDKFIGPETVAQVQQVVDRADAAPPQK